jgi:hypothetical protein
MLLAAASVQIASAAAADTAMTSFLDGEWEGSLDVIDPRPDDAEPATKLRLHVHGKTAEVFVLDKDDHWIEAKKGKFNAFQHNFNAVIFASDSQPGACWDETWSFALTLDNANQLVTKFSRVVSNIRCLKPDAKSFGSQATGLLKQRGAASPAH